MQILTLHSWSNAFDFEKLLHTRETQLMICTASCAVSHWGLAGSTALTQTCAARDRGFLPHLYCLTATMLPQTAISHWIPCHTENITYPYLMNTGQSDGWLQSKDLCEVASGIALLCWFFYRDRWLCVVSVTVVNVVRLSSCFNKVGSPVLVLTVRNMPPGLWKWRNTTTIW